MKYVSLIICAALVVLRPVPTCGEGIATGEFFRQSAFNGISMSPQGDKLAYVPGAAGAEFGIVVIDLPAASSIFIPLPHTNPAGPLAMSLGWATNQRLVFSFDSGLILAVNADGSALRILFEAEGGDNRVAAAAVRHYLPGDSNNVLMQVREVRTLKRSNFSSAEYRSPGFSEQAYYQWNFYKLNIFTGRREAVYSDTEGFHAFALGRTGEIRAALKVSGSKEEIYIRGPKNDWRSLEDLIGNDSIRFSFDPNADLYAQSLHTLLEFDYAPHYVYFSAAGNGDKLGIYRLDLRGGQTKRMLPEHDTYDLVNFSSDYPTRLLFSDSRKKLVGLRYVVEKPEVQWLDTYFRSIQIALDKTLPGKVNAILDWNLNEDRFLVHSFSSVDPGSYYVFNKNDNVLSKIGSYNDALDSELLAPMEPIQFHSRDGLTIHGYLTKPRNTTGNKLPLVVFPHGGPWWRDTYGYNPAVQLLAHHGYAVLQVNFRGSTGYGARHFTAARRDFAHGMMNDLKDGIDYVIASGIVDSTRIAVIGNSYGGYAALMMLCHYPDYFRCGASFAGVYDLRDLLDSYAARGTDDMQYQSLLKMLGPRAELAEISPIHHIEKLRAPLLLVHGSEDPLIPPEQAEDLSDGLQSAGKQFDYLVLEREGHNAWNPANTVQVYDTLLKFLRQHL